MSRDADTTVPAEIEVPREFLPLLSREATIWVAGTAGDVNIVDYCGAEFEPCLERLRIAIAARDRLLNRQAVELEPLRQLVKDALTTLHYALSEHDHEDLDDLVRQVDVLRRLTIWHDELKASSA